VCVYTIHIPHATLQWKSKIINSEYFTYRSECQNPQQSN